MMKNFLFLYVFFFKNRYFKKSSDDILNKYIVYKMETRLKKLLSTTTLLSFTVVEFVTNYVRNQD